MDIPPNIDFNEYKKNFFDLETVKQHNQLEIKKNLNAFTFKILPNHYIVSKNGKLNFNFYTKSFVARAYK